MIHVRIAFKKLNDVTLKQMRTAKIKSGYKYFSTHIIFGIKMDGNFTRKSRLVTYGPNIDAISSITSSILVSRKNVSISFLVLPFIDLDICACKIRNT